MGEASDITVIFMTINRMPQKWVDFHMGHLKAAVEGLPVITVSRIPMDFGTNIIDEGPFCYANIYRQILKASKVATTKYIGIAEDDTLYHENHFHRFRPQDDEFAYNRLRWSVFTWGEPQFSLRNRVSNCACIAPRELMIEALEERFRVCGPNPRNNMMGECGRNRLEAKLGLTLRKSVDFYSRIPIVQMSHPSGTEDRQKIQWKSHAEVRAFEIPYWGRAEDILKFYNESEI